VILWAFTLDTFCRILIDLAMRNRETTRLREAWIPQARGQVLEIGIGSGLNLPFYSAEVKHVFGVDPSLDLQQLAKERAGGRVDVDFLPQSAEQQLPIEGASIDTIVMTWTLCSIPNPDKALSEMRRVLKTDGQLRFIEHGRSRDSGVMAWQDRLTPAWRLIAGGCHLNRKIDELISAAGFRISKLNTFYIVGPRPMTYTYQGLAQLA
jgi:ubiquinone/menaquinone biosynthesis C-methylase UbiE